MTAFILSLLKKKRKKQGCVWCTPSAQALTVASDKLKISVCIMCVFVLLCIYIPSEIKAAFMEWLRLEGSYGSHFVQLSSSHIGPARAQDHVQMTFPLPFWALMHGKRKSKYFV